MSRVADQIVARRLLESGEARRIRETAGLSGCEVARQLRVSPAAVSLWERGLRRPGDRHAAQYARILRDALEASAALT